MNEPGSRFADNYERVKRRNIERERRGETIESSDPRVTHQRNPDPEVQAAIDEIRLTDDERRGMVKNIRRRFVREQFTLCGPPAPDSPLDNSALGPDDDD